MTAQTVTIGKFKDKFLIFSVENDEVLPVMNLKPSGCKTGKILTVQCNGPISIQTHAPQRKGE
jgi:hypothetical protein